MIGWIVLVAAAQAYLVAWIALTTVAMRLRGVPIRQVSLGIGPGVSRGRVRLGLLPIGGYVQGPDDAPLGALRVLPHLALLVAAAALTPADLRHDVGVWLGGWVGLGELRLGVLHGAGRAAAVAAERPLAAGGGVALVLGGMNVAQGLVEGLGQRLGERSAAGALIPALGWLALVLGLAARGLWLDLAPL